jgi:hypothetical protein
MRGGKLDEEILLSLPCALFARGRLRIEECEEILGSATI